LLLESGVIDPLRPPQSTTAVSIPISAAISSAPASGLSVASSDIAAGKLSSRQLRARDLKLLPLPDAITAILSFSGMLDFSVRQFSIIGGTDSLNIHSRIISGDITFWIMTSQEFPILRHFPLTELPGSPLVYNPVLFSNYQVIR
jgi:hypothetical protein